MNSKLTIRLGNAYKVSSANTLWTKNPRKFGQGDLEVSSRTQTWWYWTTISRPKESSGAAKVCTLNQIGNSRPFSAILYKLQPPNKLQIYIIWLETYSEGKVAFKQGKSIKTLCFRWDLKKSKNLGLCPASHMCLTHSVEINGISSCTQGICETGKRGKANHDGKGIQRRRIWEQQ